MASKPKLKTFNVERRINVWVSKDIQAENFDAAVAAAKELDASDFIQTTYDGHGIIDSYFLPGFGVRESW